MNKLLQLFKRGQDKAMTDKDRIVARLLENGHINATEATILLKTIDIKIEAQTLEMSSGAKIIGGCDFETTDYGH